MLQSMTGFGKTEINLPDKKIIIEIKSLNSKNIDSNIKLPAVYREKELLIRRMIQNQLKRGKIDFNIYYELNEGITPASINKSAFQNYFLQLKDIQTNLNIESKDITSSILKLPDTIRTKRMTLSDEEWKLLHEGILSAIEQLKEFREQEGNAMAADLQLRVKKIMVLLDSVKEFETSRIDVIKERIRKAIEENGLKEHIDENRFEQEMIYYIEKFDITEEKIRLLNHCNYFNETMVSGGEAGKKLAFIAQEMGREINTLGSKANNSDLQHIVVQMKDELEKIKEQILNVL